MAKLIKILSIDGGGIRGIIPAVILSEIEKRTGKRVSELFNLIAGTSSGGIIALALVKPDEDAKPQFEASELITLFEKNGERIFSQSFKQKIQPFSRYTEVKYLSEGIESVFEEYFGSTRLKDVLGDVLVTSYDFERQRPVFFKSSRARNEPDHDFFMKDAARATSAVPAYFEPFKLEMENGEDYYALIDGLIFAGNPTLCAYAEAKCKYPGTRDFMVVSLGTGKAKHRQIFDEVKEWGTVQWGRNILDMLLHGTSVTVDYQMRQLIPASSRSSRYYRFQTKIDKENEQMDDTDPANIRTLKLLGEELIRENNAMLDELCELLTK
ncbi:MAG: patatin-like phospholipase family protein [Candidatus Hatepunaea meridiana]|nr:patatin-like phospholipase family protein [Candidatus Hatepunaea meridiana]